MDVEDTKENGEEISTVSPPADYESSRFILDDCTSSGTSFNWPPGIAPDHRPPGWDSPSTLAPTVTTIQLFECHRIQLETFERGPVKIVFFTSSNSRAPDTCSETPSVAFILFKVLVDDQDLAEHFASVWGMPAQYATIEFAETPVGDIRISRWTWGEQNGVESFMEFNRLRVAPGPTETASGFFWDSGEGIGKYTSISSYSLSLGSSFVAHGLVHGLEGPIDPLAWSGLAATREEAKIDGSFTLYGDYECTIGF